MIVVPRSAPPARRWLAHLLRASERAIRPGDPFDDDFAFDAAEVLRLAVSQRVAPLLYRALAAGRIGDEIPAAFGGACERLYYGAFRKNAIALETGDEVLAALGGVGIDAAPLKGWAFQRGGDPLYDDPGTRPMDDLDLIVRPADREKAAATLAGLGFACVTPELARGGHEVALHRREAGVDVFVELHWAWAGSESLMRDFAVSGDRFLDELCEEDDDGTRRPTHLGHLLFTAVHAARHAFDRWIWLVDLHRLVSRRETDWPVLLDATRRWRVRGPLYAALAATRELLRSAIPKEALADLAPGPMRRRLLHRSLAISTAGDARAAWTAKVLLGESWWDVARTAAWAVAPGEAWYEGRGERPTPARRAAHPLRMLRPATRGE